MLLTKDNDKVKPRPLIRTTTKVLVGLYLAAQTLLTHSYLLYYLIQFRYR